MFKTLDDIKNHIQNAINDMHRRRDPQKKTVVILCHQMQYRSLTYGLVEALSPQYNVFVVVAQNNPDAFQKDHEHYFIPCSINTGQQEFPVDINLDWIDVIISPDINLNEGQKFLSQTAKRIYLPHTILGCCGTQDEINSFDFIFIPTRLTLDKSIEHIKSVIKNDTLPPVLIPGGYVKLEESTKRYNTLIKTQQKDSIIYAPTLRSNIHPHHNLLNAIIGFDENIITSLLNSFTENIIYRPHPFNSLNNFTNVSTIKQKFKNEPRFIYDDNNLPVKSYVRAKILLTDQSKTAFTFAFTTLLPTVFYTPIKYQDNDFFKIAQHIGRVAPTLKQSILDLHQLMQQEDRQSIISQYRKEQMFHLNKTKEYLASCIDTIIQGKTDPQWYKFTNNKTI